jgi:acetolactate synthase-1/2/3 large subunit
METNGARRILEILIAHGIDTVAGIPGGNILPLYDALHGSTLRHVLARHEQGAAFIAQGIARSSGRIGVCLATSGPGARLQRSVV